MDEFAQAVSDLKVCLKTMDQIPLDLGQNSCVRIQRPKSDRFLVNLYEWPIEEKKRRSLKLRTIDNVGKQVTHQSDHLLRKKLAMDQFVQLKSRRDVECLKIKEASKVLKYLNECSRYGFWLERLLAEKVLLSSGKAVELLTTKIREEYVEVGARQVQIATISASNVQFQLDHVRKPNQTSFFILLLTNDLDVQTSKFERATGGQIHFDETFTFQVHRDFKIKLQLCAISMKEPPKHFALTKFLRCHKIDNTSAKLQYKNPNTCDFEESEVLKTSFRVVAETEITVSNFHNTAWKLQQEFGLSDYVHLNTRVENFKICTQKSGFLTLGQVNGFWKRQWCFLDDHFLQIYNSPDEESEPIKVLDLAKCRKVGLASEGLCNRPRTFFVEMSDGEMCFFMADCSSDLGAWLGELELVLDLLLYQSL
nr:PREDICTED: uncharacterized protein LOC107398700 [Tribolium castaneum]|eukprot:XP_015839293.1 PREDICTED: uncharacterized protein LOC107398700 [Tribolium castaneum]